MIAGTGTSTLQGGSGTEVMYSSIGNATLIAGTGSDTLYGGTGTDVLQGNSGATLFIAGGGNETIIGGTGSNTYEFDAGFGNVELKNVQAGDTFNFGTGISAADLTVGATTGSDGSPALLIQTSDGGQLVIDGGMAGAVGTFNFADSGPMTVDQLLAQSNYAESTVVGANGDSSIFGGNGNSILTGGTGNNTFFVQGSDNTIYVTNSSDVINAQPNSVNNTVVAGVNFALQDNVQNLTLTGTDNLTAAGNAQDNAITANGGDDTLSGGGGNDTLIGGTGQDTFVMGYGMGHDTVVDSSSAGGIVQLTGGLTANNLAVTRQNNDLILQSGANDSLCIQNYYDNPQTVWSIQDGSGSVSVQSVLDNIAQQSEATTQERLFINSAVNGIYAGLTSSTLAYTQQADGSYYAQWTVYPAFAYDTIEKVTSTTTQYYQGAYFYQYDRIVTLAPVVTFSDSWSLTPYDYYAAVGARVVGYDVSINQVTTAPDDSASVIYADPTYSSNSQNMGYQWFQTSWTTTVNPNPTSWGNYISYAYIYENGTSYSSNATGLGALLGYQSTDNEYVTYTNIAYGTPIGGPLASPGNLQTSGAYPQALQSQYTDNQNVYEIQTINLGSSDQTVYANGQIVNTSTGNDTIYDAGFAYGGAGNDTMIGGGTLMAGTGNNLLENGDTLIAGTGNDTLVGGNTMVAGTGADQIFAGSGSADIQIDPNSVSSDLIGGSGTDQSQLLAAVYQAAGITNVQESTDYGGMYRCEGEFGGLPPFVQGGGYVFYFTSDQLPLMTGQYQWVADYINNNPQLVSYVQPLPEITLPAANDFLAMAPYFDNGILPQHTVDFGPGISVADLHFSWGQTLGSITGNADDPKLFYTTLNISWGTNNQSIQVMIPHSDDPLGSGTSQFTFADGTTLSMADMIAMAPAAPTFDPGIFVFKPGMGAQVMDGSYDAIRFSTGITAGNLQFFLQGADLLITDSSQGDSALITNFAPDGATGDQRIAQFRFADGSTGSYVNDGQGNAYLNAFDANGVEKGDFWQYSDGRYGNDTSNADGSGFGTGYYPNGVHSYTYTDDGHGAYNELDYDPDGRLAGDYWERADGSYGDDTFNADGTSRGDSYNPDNSYSTYINDGYGNITTNYFDAFGSLTAYSVLNGDGYGNGTLTNFDANGTELGYSILTNDGSGNTTTTNYDNSGIKLDDRWVKADGAYGNDTFNADGSISGAAYNTDGSHSNYVNDGYGELTTNNFDAQNRLVSDGWTHADGSTGSDNFDPVTGSIISSTINAGLGGGETLVGGAGQNTFTFNLGDGLNVLVDAANQPAGASGNDILSFGAGITSKDVSFQVQGSDVLLSYSLTDSILIKNFDLYGVNGTAAPFGTYQFADGSSIAVWIGDNFDGAGSFGVDIYDAQGARIGDQWAYNDGSFGTVTFYADGSGSSVWQWADGSHFTDIWYADGSEISTSQFADGSYATDIWNADGSSTGSSHNADGSYSQYAYDTSRNYSESSYNSSGFKISDSWSRTDGSNGFDVFNTDGSSSGTWYAADGSYSSYTNDGLGDVTTTSFDANGNQLGYSTAIDNGLGNTTTTNFDAGGNKLKDSWTKSDGSHGSDTFNADGTSTGTAYAADGSYSTYANDGNGHIVTQYYDANGNPIVNNTGPVTTSLYDVNGNLIGSSVAVSDGQGSTSVTNYDLNGTKLGDTWVKADGSKGSDTFNVDGSSSGTTTNADSSYSTYTNDGHGNATTINYDANGNELGYTASTNDGQGSTTTTDYNATTGEVSGSVATAGAGYSYTYDNTKDVGGVAGTTESKVAYTYADGSTYSTDTVYETDGSYQQSTAKGDGSTTTTDYNATTGEVSGSVATAGAGYSYTYDNTKDVGGVAGATESKVAYTYADGSTYATDTVYEADGSYQQSTAKGDGSTTTTDYIATTGEVSGSVATAGAGYSYTYDNTKDVGGVSGVTESKVTYTYADGSAYSTDTVYEADGSYQQSTAKGDGSTTTTDYNAATGEVIGSVATAGAGYSYTYDNTQNVGGVAGVTESKVDYTYADGSTYATDTVYDPNGSYQQSTAKGDGSTTTTNYDAVTGEVSGSVATAGAGYSYTYDNTKNVNGVSGETESKINYTYADGNTYATDTVYNPDHSYFQAWGKSDGTSGSSAVNADGTLAGDSRVHADGSQGVDAGGNHLLVGSTASDIPGSRVRQRHPDRRSRERHLHHRQRSQPHRLQCRATDKTSSTPPQARTTPSPWAATSPSAIWPCRRTATTSSSMSAPPTASPSRTGTQEPRISSTCKSSKPPCRTSTPAPAMSCATAMSKPSTSSNWSPHSTRPAQPTPASPAWGVTNALLNAHLSSAATRPHWEAILPMSTAARAASPA